MKIQNAKTNLALTSLATALVVGVVNTASALIVYHSFIANKPSSNSNAPFITSSSQSSNPSEQSATTNKSTPSGSTSSPSASSGSYNISNPKIPASQIVVRKPSAPLVVGQAPKPVSVSTDPTSGQTVYHWCSGINPALEDGVCEAIVSIVSSPTASNPHLSNQAKQSLSLLPQGTSLTMDESSWVATSATSGSMNVTAHTTMYGDVPLKISLEKVNGTWIVQDGQLA